MLTEREKNENNSSIRKSVLNLVIYFSTTTIGVFFITLLFSLIFAIIIPSEELENSTNLLLATVNFVTYLLCFFILFFVNKKFILEDFKSFTKIKITTIIKYTILSILALYTINILINILYEQLGILGNSDNQEGLNTLLNSSTIAAVLTNLSVVLLGPFVEELVFRYSLMNFFKKHSSVVRVLVSSFLFGLIHVISTFDFVFLPVYFCLGLVFGIVYNRKNSLFLCFFIHALYNLSTLLV